MIISGLQKLTLLDYPGKTACTVFVCGCNLRCPFCHNTSLLDSNNCSEVISEKDFYAFISKRRGVLDGVCVTGGEPLMQEDLEAFLQKVKELGYLIKIDTNGCFPRQLKALVAKGLIDYVAMDMKSSPTCYSTATGISDVDLQAIRESIDFLMEDTVDYEFRTTVVKGLHDLATIQETAQMIKGAKRYFIQKYVNSGNHNQKGMSAFTGKEMQLFLEGVFPYVKSAALRGV